MGFCMNLAKQWTHNIQKKSSLEHLEKILWKIWKNTVEHFGSRKKSQLWIKYVYVVHWNGLAGVVHCTFKHEWHE